MSTMKPGELQDKVLSIRMWQRGAQRAPHKPLLILYSIGRLLSGKPRMTAFEEMLDPMKQLLLEFGPPRKHCHPEYPFCRLVNDGIWELHGIENATRRKSNTDFTRKSLINSEVEGGFPEEVASCIQNNQTFCRNLIDNLLQENFPDSMHDDILLATELSKRILQMKSSRDPAFRECVLVAYEYQCAVCGFNVKLGIQPIALEAAHIQWHQAKGPDTEENGIALCSLHHKLFDRGVFSLDSEDRIVVSDKANGTCGVKEWLLRYHGKTMNQPTSRRYRPATEFKNWHIREVFRGRQRDLY